MTTKYISAVQAAKKLGVSEETVYTYCKKGLLGGQYFKVEKKGRWRIDLNSVELLLESSSFKSTLQLKNEMQYSLF